MSCFAEIKTWIKLVQISPAIERLQIRDHHTSYTDIINSLKCSLVALFNKVSNRGIIFDAELSFDAQLTCCSSVLFT